MRLADRLKKQLRPDNRAVAMTEFALAMPFVLSSSAMREDVSAQISRLTGHRVDMQGEPSVSFSPYLSAVYRDVVIGPADAPILSADEMRVGFHLSSALLGRTHIEEVSLLLSEAKRLIVKSG